MNDAAERLSALAAAIRNAPPEEVVAATDELATYVLARNPMHVTTAEEAHVLQLLAMDIARSIGEGLCPGGDNRAVWVMRWALAGAANYLGMVASTEPQAPGARLIFPVQTGHLN